MSHGFLVVREILTLPDPCLKTSVEPVDTVTDEHRRLYEDMKETVLDSPGVALAAPQIGEMVPAIYVDVSLDRRRDEPNHGEIFLVNPVIETADDPETVREGCLSVPDFTGNVRRYQTVTVSGRTKEGNKTTFSAEGWEAVALQHEIDHLDGTLFLDRVESPRRDLFRRSEH